MSDSDPRESILITDIASRIIDGNISTEIRKDHWVSVPYCFETIGEGVCVEHNDEWSSGPLTIRLDVKGYYRIQIISRYGHLRLKLTGDRCFTPSNPVMQGHEKEGWYDAQEWVWREADLTGQDLILDGARGGLAAIRLVPVVSGYKDESIRYPMVFTHDSGVMCQGPHHDPNDLFQWCEKVPDDGCAKVVIWSAGLGDVAMHHVTKVGTTFGEVTTETWGPGHRPVIENIAKYQSWEIDPLKHIVGYANERGWESYFYVRHRGYGYCQPISGAFDSVFFGEHPEYHNIGPNGERVLGLSVAFPEVREHLCKFYAELAAAGPTGVSPCFIRGCPIVLYEQPMLEGFEHEYGIDPRTLDEDDPRWLAYGAKVVTGFMRELKKAVGPDCKLSPTIHGTKQLNDHFAMDIETWVREGIVDDLFIMCHTYDECGNHTQAGPEMLEYEWFESMEGRPNVRLWPMFYMWQNFEADPQGHCDALRNWCEQGADGYGFWDAAAIDEDKVGNSWYLGKESYEGYQKKDRFVALYRVLEFNGFSFSRYTPVEGW